MDSPSLFKTLINATISVRCSRMLLFNINEPSTTKMHKQISFLHLSFEFERTKKRTNNNLLDQCRLMKDQKKNRPESKNSSKEVLMKDKNCHFDDVEMRVQKESSVQCRVHSIVFCPTVYTSHMLHNQEFC